jgi:deoxyribodipyrimidine photolyase
LKNQPFQPTRIQYLNHRPIQKGHYVLYWMQQSQRAEYNHALEYAVPQANVLGQEIGLRTSSITSFIATSKTAINPRRTTFPT